MGGEIRRHASIMKKIEEEMERRKEETGAYTREGVLTQLEQAIKRMSSLRTVPEGALAPSGCPIISTSTGRQPHHAQRQPSQSHR